MPKARTILVGIGGGIAVYKAVDLVSRLVQAGHEVHVAMTPAARRFVTPTTFASISRRRVLTDIFPEEGPFEGEALFPHLYPAARADLFVVLPATADLLAKIAAGIADDIVSAAALGVPPAAIRVCCPAMNHTMWAQPVVQRNALALRDAGWTQLGPAVGALACGVEGEGRMCEPGEIANAIAALLARAGDLAGRRILMLSGPTREHLDPVRFLGNASSGRMGAALAEEAARRGASVVFVTGPVDPARLPRGPGIEIVPVTSAGDMLEAARSRREGADLEIFAAAVSDYAPAEPSAGKAPKQAKPEPLALIPTPDIAATLAATRPATRLAVGFALESEAGRERAAKKLEKKGLDAIVLNGPAAMGAESAAFSFREARAADFEPWGELPKAACARRILDWAATRLAESSSGAERQTAADGDHAAFGAGRHKAAYTGRV